MLEGIIKYSDAFQNDLIESGIADKNEMTPVEKIASVHIDFDKDNNCNPLYKFNRLI